MKNNGQDGPGNSCNEHEAMEIDFSTLIMSFASAAMISLGKIADPSTGQMCRNLALAQQNINILTLLKDKTKGNLTPEEGALMDSVLYELRINYVEALKG